MAGSSRRDGCSSVRSPRTPRSTSSSIASSSGFRARARGSLWSVRYSAEVGRPFHVVDDDTVVLSLDHPFVKEGRFASLLVGDRELAVILQLRPELSDCADIRRAHGRRRTLLVFRVSARPTDGPAVTNGTGGWFPHLRGRPGVRRSRPGGTAAASSRLRFMDDDRHAAFVGVGTAGSSR